jgi:hypothetical protein
VKELLNIKDNIFETSVAADPMQLSSTLDPWVFISELFINLW